MITSMILSKTSDLGKIVEAIKALTGVVVELLYVCREI